MQLCIPLEIWQQMRGYCLASHPNEVTGIGTISLIDGNLIVDQIFIPQQVANPGYCESDKGALNEIIFNVVKDNPARAGKLRFRWHSHAGGSVFWSATDEKDIDDWQGPWVANLVMNIHDDYIARLDVYEGIRLRNIPLDVKIMSPIPNEVMLRCEQEIKAKVKHSPFRLSPNPLEDLKPATLDACAEVAEQHLKGGDIHEAKLFF